MDLRWDFVFDWLIQIWKWKWIFGIWWCHPILNLISKTGGPLFWNAADVRNWIFEYWNQPQYMLCHANIIMSHYHHMLDWSFEHHHHRQQIIEASSNIIILFTQYHHRIIKYINIIIFGFENHVSSMKGHDIQLQRNVMLIINRIKENWRNVVEISKFCAMCENCWNPRGLHICAKIVAIHEVCT